MIGNTQLVDHGIQTEDSDIRAHVSVSNNTVYVFATKWAMMVLNSNKYDPIPVWSNVNGNRIQTATGYLVPIVDIKPGEIYAKNIIESVGFVDGDYSTTSHKGQLAQKVIEDLLQRGLIPLPASPHIVTDVEIQRSGIDLIVRGQWKIEVKCDWKAGDTGNLFLQVAECNPLGQY